MLAKTRNFTMLPVPKEGLTIAGNQGGSRAGQEEVEDPEEEEEEQELPIPRLSVPARKSSKRKSSARTVFQVDDWEIGPSPSPELAFNDDQPSPPKKTRFTAATSVSSSKRNLRARTLASSSRAAKGKSAFRRGSQAAALQRIEEEYDLEPHTLISDLNLPDSVNKVLTECSIFTLEDLRNAIKGDNSYFSEGTDIPVEDFLSFMQIKLSHFAKGNIGFQYDFNRENDNGANGGNTLEDDEDQEDMGDRIKRGYINDCLTILKAGRVLTRALRAVQWH